MATIAEQIQSVKAWIRLMRKETCIRLLETLDKETEGTSVELKKKLRALLKPEDTELVRKIIKFKTLLDDEMLRSIKGKELTIGLEKDEEDLQSEEEELSDVQSDEETDLRDTDFRGRTSSIKPTDSQLNRKTGEAHSREPSPNRLILTKDLPTSRQTDNSAPLDTSSVRRSELATLMDTVRKWNIKFGGNKKPTDAMLFLERLEETAHCYDITLDHLPKVMPELLKDAPLEWYRNNKKDWKSWSEFTTSFKMFFVPKRLQTDYELEVERCLQTKDQKIGEYIIAIQYKPKCVG